MRLLMTLVHLVFTTAAAATYVVFRLVFRRKRFWKAQHIRRRNRQPGLSKEHEACGAPGEPANSGYEATSASPITCPCHGVGPETLGSTLAHLEEVGPTVDPSSSTIGSCSQEATAGPPSWGKPVCSLDEPVEGGTKGSEAALSTINSGGLQEEGEVSEKQQEVVPVPSEPDVLQRESCTLEEEFVLASQVAVCKTCNLLPPNTANAKGATLDFHSNAGELVLVSSWSIPSELSGAVQGEEASSRTCSQETELEDEGNPQGQSSDDDSSRDLEGMQGPTASHPVPDQCHDNGGAARMAELEPAPEGLTADVSRDLEEESSQDPESHACFASGIARSASPRRSSSVPSDRLRAASICDVSFADTPGAGGEDEGVGQQEASCTMASSTEAASNGTQELPLANGSPLPGGARLACSHSRDVLEGPGGNEHRRPTSGHLFSALENCSTTEKGRRVGLSMERPCDDMPRPDTFESPPTKCLPEGQGLLDTTRTAIADTSSQEREVDPQVEAGHGHEHGVTVHAAPGKAPPEQCQQFLDPWAVCGAVNIGSHPEMVGLPTGRNAVGPSTEQPIALGTSKAVPGQNPAIAEQEHSPISISTCTQHHKDDDPSVDSTVTVAEVDSTNQDGLLGPSLTLESDAASLLTGCALVGRTYEGTAGQEASTGIPQETPGHRRLSSEEQVVFQLSNTALLLPPNWGAYSGTDDFDHSHTLPSPGRSPLQTLSSQQEGPFDNYPRLSASGSQAGTPAADISCATSACAPLEATIPSRSSVSTAYGPAMTRLEGASLSGLAAVKDPAQQWPQVLVRSIPNGGKDNLQGPGGSGGPSSLPPLSPRSIRASMPSHRLRTCSTSNKRSSLDNTPCGAPHLELTVLSGPAEGTRFSTPRCPHQVRVGRYPDCDLALTDQEVSGTHALIYWQEQAQEWEVMDAGSLNGTTLNGQVISKPNRQPGDRVVLADEDVLAFGSATSLRVRCCPSRPAKRLHVLEVPPSPSARAEPVGTRSLSSATSTSLQLHPFLQHPISASPPRTTLLPLVGEKLLSQRSSLETQIEPPLMFTFPACRLWGTIHKKVGSDHWRQATPTEDVACWHCPMDGHPTAGVFCLLDGHQGCQAAQQAASLLPKKLEELSQGRASVIGSDSDQMLEGAFLETDSGLLVDDGCTATAILAEKASNGSVYVQGANVGDSAAILIRLKSAEWLRLTEDHRITNNSIEQARLKLHSGREALHRHYGLNIARMLGDRVLKEADLGFSAQPFVSAIECIGADDMAVVVVASDGLWDVVGAERASGIVNKMWESGRVDPNVVGEALMTAAVQSRSRDDVTIMVLAILPEKSSDENLGLEELQDT